MAYIGLDIGTSGCKAAVIAEDGACLARAHRSYPIFSSHRGYAELEPAQIWKAVQEVLREVAPMGREGDHLAISGIGEAFVLLDKEDRPLSRFITYLDTRGEAELARLYARISERGLYDITGIRPNRTYSLGRLWWMKQAEPRLLGRAAKLMFFSEYFAYLLTGIRAVDPATALRSLMLNRHTHEWDSALLTLADVPPSWLAPVLPMGTELGRLLPEVAENLGLPAKLNVLLGCHDQCAATLGAGVWYCGDVMLGEGSSESLNMVVEADVAAPTDPRYESAIVAEPFLDGKHVLLAAQSAFCTNLKWFMQTLSGKEDFVRWDQRCAPETNVLFIPHTSTLNVMNAEGSSHGAFIGLTLDVTKEELYRAVLAGLHFESRRNLEQLRRLGGPCRRLIATGGNSQSTLSMQIKADILQMPITTLASPDAGIAGLAMVCAVSTRGCKDYAEAMGRFVCYGKTYQPGRDYTAAYQRYCEYSDCMRLTERRLEQRAL